MSDRRTSTFHEQMRDMLRALEDRVYRLETGGAIAGHLSLESSFDMGADLGGDAGGISFEVIPWPDVTSNGRRLTITNMITGSTHIIDLP